MTHGADHTNGDRMDLGRRDGVFIVKGLVLGVQSAFLRRMDGMQLLRHFLFLLQKKDCRCLLHVHESRGGKQTGGTK